MMNRTEFLSEEEKEALMMKDVAGMFLLKDACTHFCEEAQMEISEVMYK